MRIQKTLMPTLAPVISLILMSVFFITACVPNYAPFYTAGKVETLAEVRKQQEMKNYMDQFKQKRDAFELSLDKFYVDSLREAEAEGLLDADGVIYLNKREVEFRSQYNANEAAALARLDNNLMFYDDIIELQGMTRESISQAQLQNASAFNELVEELEKYAAAEAEAAVIRRMSYLKSQQGKPIPEVEGPLVGEVFPVIQH